MKITIVGAGISGLCCAIFLKEAGFDPVIIERNSELRSFGAGLQLGPNATAILDRYGFKQTLAELASFPDSINFHDLRIGKRLLKISTNNYEKTYGSKYCYLMREDLIKMLYNKCQQLGVDIKFNYELQSIDLNEKGYLLKTNQGKLETQKLIGADGVHSIARKSLTNQHIRFVKKVAWRGTAPLDRVDDIFFADVNVWLGRKMHAVFYQIPKQNLLNFIIVTSHTSSEAFKSTYSNSYEVDQLLESFNLYPKIQQALKVSRNLYKWKIETLPNTYQFSSKDFALIGDAAHPILPFMAQGASLGIEDAYLLALNLGKGAEDFSNFYKQRQTKVKRVSYYSKTSGQIYHLPFVFRYLALKLNAFMPFFLSRRLAYTFRNILEDE